MSAVISAIPVEIISVDPSTGEELGRVPSFSDDDVQEALARSREAFAEWRATSFAERRELVMAAREVILGELDEIAGLISAETGKPVAEALAMEVAPVLDLMRHFAESAEKMLRPRRIGIGLYSLFGRSSKIIYHPLGPVAIIPAWNFPFSIPMGEAAMALMAGNSVLIKPSELTPMVGVKIGEIFERAGAPEALVQILTGAGGTGAALVKAGPAKVMFTGSVATGKKILAAAAEKMTPVVLELGGKDPMIVFEDADLELAAGGAVWGAFCNSGQACSSVERLYVHESVADEFTRMVVEKARRLKQGRGTDDDVSIGAMTSETQLSKVEEHVADFVKSGAIVETGGRRAAMDGTFFEPTVISGASNQMLGMREETFGPTLPIATFTTEAEAIELANDSEFGLTASVWTRDSAKGRRVAEQIEAGTVCVNEVLYTHGIGQTPWGGVKNSGRGRTHGIDGLMELVEPRHIHVNRIALLPDAWWFPYSGMAKETFKAFATHFASGSMVRFSRMVPLLHRRINEVKRSGRKEKDAN